MKYKRLLAFVPLILVIVLSFPGCGKKGDEEVVEDVSRSSADRGVRNNFTANDGEGQAGIRSLTSCYSIDRNGDGSIDFPIATAESNPHYYDYSGSLLAVAYVADTVFRGGYVYTKNSGYNDELKVYISNDDRYFSGEVHLDDRTVDQILDYVGRSRNDSSLCVDGVVFGGNYGGVQFYSGTMYGEMILYVENREVIYF